MKETVWTLYTFAHRTRQPRRKYSVFRGIQTLAPGLLEFAQDFSLPRLMREANSD